ATFLEREAPLVEDAPSFAKVAITLREHRLGALDRRAARGELIERRLARAQRGGAGFGGDARRLGLCTHGRSGIGFSLRSLLPPAQPGDDERGDSCGGEEDGNGEEDGGRHVRLSLWVAGGAQALTGRSKGSLTCARRLSANRFAAG